MPGEEELQHLCQQEIQAFLDAQEYGDVVVGDEVPIIKDCTFVYEDQMKMYLGHAKTDVCIYFQSDELSAHLTESDVFKLYQNADKDIRIPLLILETKRGDADGHVSTDAIRSRTVIAREINEVFPFCSYNFLADRAHAVLPGKIHRAGKHYDDFFLAPKKANPDWINEVIIENAVEPHLENLQREGIIPVNQ